MAIFAMLFLWQKINMPQIAQVLRIFSFNDGFTKAFRIFSVILCNFLAAYENFMIFFLFFCKKVLTKRKISAIIPGVGANILAKQRAVLCGKR